MPVDERYGLEQGWSIRWIVELNETGEAPAPGSREPGWSGVPDDRGMWRLVDVLLHNPGVTPSRATFVWTRLEFDRELYETQKQGRK